MKEFNINFLDHVAIRVRNIEISVEWYQNVIGLEKCFYLNGKIIRY